MKIINLLILIIVLSLFLGCNSSIFSGNGSSQIGVNEEDDIGDGVEMQISSISSNGILATSSILFSIDLKNRNSEPIELSQENLNIQVIPGGIELFSQESLNSFYDEIFRGDTLYLSDVLSINQEVSLTLDDSRTEFQSYIGKQITLLFLLDYEENFEQVSNLNINFEENKISKKNLVKKTGPLEAQNFDIYNSRSGKTLEFDLISKMNSQSSAQISNMNFKLGNSALNCQFSFPDEAIISSSIITVNAINSEINVFCEIPSNFAQDYSGNTDIQLSINLDYSYEETQSKTFTIPKNYLRN